MVSMDEQVEASAPMGKAPAGGEIDIARVVLTLWHHRVWVSVVTTVATLVGVLVALLAAPVYHSQATIAPKDPAGAGGSARALVQFGAMGGAASQLGIGGATLYKMEIILKGQDLAEAVIKANNLMPVLFPDSWDPAARNWKDPGKRPTLQKGAEKLRKNVLNVSINIKKNVVTVGASARDPVLAKRLVEFYLTELNNKIRRDVMGSADSDRRYLEKQLDNTLDPALLEKLHSMIAFEIEKSMLVSSQAFEIFERPAVPITRSAPQRKKIVMMFFLAGMFFSIGGVFAWKGYLALKAMVVRGGPSPDKHAGSRSFGA